MRLAQSTFRGRKPHRTNCYTLDSHELEEAEADFTVSATINCYFGYRKSSESSSRQPNGLGHQFVCSPHYVDALDRQDKLNVTNRGEVTKRR